MLRHKINMYASPKLKPAFFAIGLLLLILLNSATILAKEPSFNRIINRYLPNSHIGIIVGDAKTGKILYAKNGFALFTPASNLKLFTAAVLYSLGAQYQFQTTVGIRRKNLHQHKLNDNLYIRFSGDPTLTSKDLQKLIQNIKKQGINDIGGNIILDVSAFAKPDYANEWSLEDTNWYFGAPVNSIILDENSVPLSILPAKTIGEKPTVTLLLAEKNRYIKIDNQLQTVTHDQFVKHCSMHTEVDQDNTIHLSGCVSIDAKDLGETSHLALRNPLAYAQAIIQDSLLQEQVQLKGKIITAPIPDDLNFIAKVKSPPVYKLVATMLKNSNNLFAESFTKTLGQVNFQQGSFQEGVNAITSILEPITNIDFSKIKIYDGSGLSHHNLLTPYSIFRLLYVIYHDKKMKDYFIAALAKPTEEGTLKKRLNAFDTAKFIQAKTGSMS